MAGGGVGARRRAPPRAGGRTNPAWKRLHEASGEVRPSSGSRAPAPRRAGYHSGTRPRREHACAGTDAGRRGGTRKNSPEEGARMPELPPLGPGRWADAPVRYPDPAVSVLDPRFEGCRLTNAAVERIATGFRWVEGPVWFGDHDCLVFSDIPSDRMLRWEARTGDVRVFREPSAKGNGNIRDRQGRLVTCEHRTRRVTRTEHDGSLTGSPTATRAAGSTRRTTWWSARRRRVVHRPRLRDHVGLRGRARRLRTPHGGVPDRPRRPAASRAASRAAASSGSSTTSTAPTASASHPTAPASTSSTPARPARSTSTT